jgi:hypothetical protein
LLGLSEGLVPALEREVGQGGPSSDMLLLVLNILNSFQIALIEPLCF